MTKDQFIFEKLALEGEGYTITTTDIGFDMVVHALPDFTTWEGFGWMWERATEKEWFFNFFQHLPKGVLWRAEIYKTLCLCNPTRLRDALADYLGWEEK